jgi:hypothetical protein
MRALMVGERVCIEGAGLAILDESWEGNDTARGVVRRVDPRSSQVTVTLDAAYGGLTVVVAAARIRANAESAAPQRKRGLLRLLERIARVRA